jgi:hypothetical protein
MMAATIKNATATITVTGTWAREGKAAAITRKEPAFIRARREKLVRVGECRASNGYEFQPEWLKEKSA